MKIKPKKIFNVLFFSLFMLYISLFISSETGYYEYKNKEQVKFTQEKIKQFEEDLKSGKKIDINNYTKKVTKRYDNKITRFGNTVSDIVNYSMMDSLEKTFNFVEKLIE